jgi:Lar family restriction alleviation protein
VVYRDSVICGPMLERIARHALKAPLPPETLKPCPLCGAEEIKELINYATVECEACGANTGDRGLIQKARAAWNTRPGPTP